jgi:TetR/AcrR family transcriptional regulator, ethionamide resistance regulator
VESSTERERQREQRDNTGEEILAAADRFLRVRPFRELSVEAVMAEAGHTRTSFYRHFDSVTDVMLRLLADLGRNFYSIGERWRARAGFDYPIGALEGLTEIVDFFVIQGPLIQAIVDASRSDEHIEQGYRMFFEAFVDMTTEALDRLVERGQLEAPDTQELARALNLMSESYLLHEFGRPPFGDRDIVLATLHTVWLRVIVPSNPS